MHKRRNADTPLVTLSKSLSWLLRHNADRENITMSDEGFVNVDEILQHKKFSQFTLSQVNEVVEKNDKQRFTLRTDPVTKKLQIKANQGHSIEIKDLALTEIINASDYPNVIHGTYIRFWNSIKSSGLSRMKRNHIHFAPGEPGGAGVISGMRASAELYIYIDMEKAIADGIKFFCSENNVILSPGNDNGVLESQYFLKVMNKKTGTLIS